mgnify:CR=1 FL=1
MPAWAAKLLVEGGGVDSIVNNTKENHKLTFRKGKTMKKVLHLEVAFMDLLS